MCSKCFAVSQSATTNCAYDTEGGFQEILERLEAGEEAVIKGNHLLKSMLKEETLRQAHNTY